MAYDLPDDQGWVDPVPGHDMNTNANGSPGSPWHTPFIALASRCRWLFENKANKNVVRAHRWGLLSEPMPIDLAIDGISETEWTTVYTAPGGNRVLSIWPSTAPQDFLIRTTLQLSSLGHTASVGTLEVRILLNGVPASTTVTVSGSGEDPGVLAQVSLIQRIQNLDQSSPGWILSVQARGTANDDYHFAASLVGAIEIQSQPNESALA